MVLNSQSEVSLDRCLAESHSRLKSLEEDECGAEDDSSDQARAHLSDALIRDLARAAARAIKIKGAKRCEGTAEVAPLCP